MPNTMLRIRTFTAIVSTTMFAGMLGNIAVAQYYGAPQLQQQTASAGCAEGCEQCGGTGYACGRVPIAGYGAQISDRAPCACTADGYCRPKESTWGYYPTKWRQWPGAVYGQGNKTAKQAAPKLQPYEPPRPELEDKKTSQPSYPQQSRPAPVEKPADEEGMSRNSKRAPKSVLVPARRTLTQNRTAYDSRKLQAQPLLPAMQHVPGLNSRPTTAATSTAPAESPEEALYKKATTPQQNDAPPALIPALMPEAIQADAKDKTSSVQPATSAARGLTRIALPSRQMPVAIAAAPVAIRVATTIAPPLVTGSDVPPLLPKSLWSFRQENSAVIAQRLARSKAALASASPSVRRLPTPQTGRRYAVRQASNVQTTGVQNADGTAISTDGGVRQAVHHVPIQKQ